MGISGRPAGRVFVTLPAACLLLAGLAALLLVPGGIYPRAAFTAVAMLCGLAWTAVVWHPLWKRLTKEPLPSAFRLAAMSGAGALLALPCAIVEFTTEQSLLVSFFAGMYGTASGFLGGLVLVYAFPDAG
ncbi:hypothetical protein GD627_15035 [Arthrobacter yangruifuii]|uniref:Uncharacterized protein n=1 Tax=Arthrobacter yangruifuii TaxID=2606616 RepID=A0A5N6MEH1_9MICC|nr:hypothetical protein [Arthrobacter yangruifuii]KAD3456020.1 hypothetical protein GD627_15035 [Arthrobacter yangruifuii]